MDLIGKVRRCFNCLNWKAPDPCSTVGGCTPPPPKGLPFWAAGSVAPYHMTGHDEGKTCPAYAHGGMNKPHPLDQSPRVTMVVCKGDMIPMRTYVEGAGGHSVAEAKVLGYGKNHLIVELFNTTHHIRIAASARQRAGTVIGVESWGVDMDAPVRRSGRPVGNLEGAESFLAGVKTGMRVPLAGLPPFDGVTKVAYVVGRPKKDTLLIRVGNRGKRMTMATTGPLAGLVTSDPLWVLGVSELNKRGD